MVKGLGPEALAAQRALRLVAQQRGVGVGLRRHGHELPQIGLAAAWPLNAMPFL